MPHRVAVVVPDGFALFELGIAIEVFTWQWRDVPGDWYDVRVCAAAPGPLTADNGIVTTVVPHGVEAIAEADTVIVPDATSVDAPADPVVLEAIADAYRRGARMVSFCTGAFVLAAAGVLDGRTVTTHWKLAEVLARKHPRVRVTADVLYVDDGQVLTSAGNAAGADLALHIVRKDHGAHVARRVARHMVLPPHRDGGQAQFVMTPIPDLGDRPSGVHRVMEHLARNVDQTFTLDDMAALAYMSSRNFSRRFREVTGTTPSQWLLHQRLTRARELLEESDEPIERIAHLSGFGSAVTFRQRFAQVLHTSPMAYRRSFRQPPPAAAGREVEEYAEVLDLPVEEGQIAS